MPNLEIMWTKVDEAPALATYSLLPIVEAFVGAAGVSVKLKDISLAGRILASFPEKLTPAQRINDELTELGELTLRPEANIMKLPNISASIPQLKAAIKELQGKGYDVPDYPDNPTTEAEKEIKARYGKVFGSVVNPILARRQFRPPRGRRRQAIRPQEPAQDGRLEQGLQIARGLHVERRLLRLGNRDHRRAATNVRIELVGADGAVTVLKAKTPLEAGEIIDAAVMSAKALRNFFAEQIEDAKKQGVLFSLHVKATMMKIADPDRVRPCRFRLLRRCDREARRHAEEARRQSQQRLRRSADEDRDAAGGREESDQGRHRGRVREAAGPRHGQFRQGDHRPACAQRLHHRRLDAGDDPRVRPHVGPRRQAARHQGRRSRIAPTRGCFRRSSRTARPTARSIPRPWARSRTSA